MKFTRRSFIQLGGAAAVAAGVLGNATSLFGRDVGRDGLFAVPVESLSDPLNYLQSAHFTPFVGTGFRGASESGRHVDLRLTSVRDLSRTINTERGYLGEGYSLMFSSREVVAPGTYRFRHSILGEFALFIGPVNRESGVAEAVVNRISRTGGLD